MHTKAGHSIAGGAAGTRARLELGDLARRLRHEVTDADQAEDTFSPVTPVVRLARHDLEKWMKAPVAEVVSRCRDVLAKSAGPAAAQAGGGTAVTVMLVGGCARTPAIQRAVAAAVGRPVTPVAAPELAALRGGIAWAVSAPAHEVPACPVPVGVRGLSWDMPDGAARLIGWRVTPGTGYGPGEPLAAVRAADDSVWDLIDDRPGTMAQTHPGPDTIVATSDLLAIARTASVIAGDLRGTPLRHSALPGGEFAAFSQDGMQLATMDTARILRIWDTETATELRRHEIKATLRRNGLDAARAPNGDWLVAYFDGSAVIVWNVTTGTQTARVSKGKDTQSVRFSADGRRLCTADLRHARIWEVTGQEVLSVKDRWQHTGCVAMRPDGQQLAVVAREGLEVWQQGGRKPTLVRALPRFKGKVWHLAFNADGEQVLFAYDTTMELAEVPSGTSLWTMADAVPITGAEFAAGGRLLATVNQPGGSLVTLRDPATGAEVGSLGKGDGPSGAARFSADGRFLATAAADTSVVWALVR